MKQLFIAISLVIAPIIGFSQIVPSEIIPFTGSILLDDNLSGTGTIIEYDGYLFIVTAKHVLAKAKDKIFKYTFYDKGRPSEKGQTISMFLDQRVIDEHLYFSDSFDIAVLHVGFPYPVSVGQPKQYRFYNGIISDLKSESLPFFSTDRFWMEEDVALGIDILAMGFPSELDNLDQTKVSVVKGIVSGFYPDGRTKLQLPIFGGNSGGPIMVYSNYSPSNYGQSVIVGSPRAYMLGIVTEFVPYIDSTVSKRGSGILLSTNSGFAKAEPIDRVVSLIKNKVLKTKK